MTTTHGRWGDQMPVQPCNLSGGRAVDAETLGELEGLPASERCDAVTRGGNVQLLLLYVMALLRA